MTKAIVFDIDGVLVDVSKSYRTAIKKTSEFFLGREVSEKEVEEIKLSRGFNNDWDCTEEIIKNEKNIEKQKIIDKFQEFYLGENFNGLIRKEKFLIKKDIIKILSKKYKLAVFTGRPRIEAEFSLKKNEVLQYFSFIIAMEDVEKGKPEPDGLLKIKNGLKISNILYIGDSIDDLETAKNAGIGFIGVIPPYADKEKLRKRFEKNGVKTILEDINNIMKVLRNFKEISGTS